MRIKHLKIKNFRGIKNGELTFPNDHRLICLIGPGDSTKYTILTAIYYALWPSWNLTVSSSDFYECNTNQSIIIEVSFDEFPESFFKEQKYGFYLRGSFDEGSDEPTDTEQFLTVRLEINDFFEPQWNIICDRLEPKPFVTSDRQLISPGMIGIDFSQNLNWGQGSALSKYIDPRETIKKNLAIIETEARNIGDYNELDAIQPIINTVADGYGVVIDEKINNKVSLKSKNVLSTIELFEGNKPFNQRGYGSKKLINLGLHVENMNKKSVILIDEIEIGLEPYRQKSLLHKLKKEVLNEGQIIFTTHSTVVLAELNISQLILVNSVCGETSFKIIANSDAHLNSKMQGMLRRIPDAFLTPRILVCEGITEVGFIRSLDDEKLQEDENYYMASRGVSYADGKGGAEALAVANRFYDLGYDVAVLVDNDRPCDSEKVEALKEKHILIYTWPKGCCIETALLPLLTKESLQNLLLWESEKKEATWCELRKEGYAKADYTFKEELQEEILDVAHICAKKEFFKRVSGGEALGNAIFNESKNIDSEKEAAKTINEIVQWISNGEKQRIFE